MIEVWLHENYYSDYRENQWEEIYLHITGTDIWITDEGYSEERLVNIKFNDLLFTDHIPQGKVLITKLGKL